MKSIFDKILDTKLGFTAVLFIILPILSFGQKQPPTPPPAPVPASTPFQGGVQSNNPIKSRNTIQDPLRANELLKNDNQRKKALEVIDNLYRKPSEKELEAVLVEQELKQKYKDFLDDKDTGITHIVKDVGCAESQLVIVVSGDCLKYSMPGNGSAFSFRVNNYRIPRLADINFDGTYFKSRSIWQHGILVNIGDVPLETVNLQLPILKYLEDFRPALEYQNALSLENEINAGIRRQNLFYSRKVFAVENATFLLRSIAYRGISRRSVEGFVYNEFDYDKRKDIIIAFRIVRKYSDGSITILWKKLSSKTSPKLLPETENDSKVKKTEYIARSQK